MRSLPGVKEGITRLFLIIAFTFLFIHRAESAPKQRLHRAYEPAAIQLDINLQQETLSLFLSINPEAVRAITGQPIDSFINRLNQFAPLMTIPEEAQCQQIQKLFLAENPGENSENSAENLGHPQITGYLENSVEENLGHPQITGYLENSVENSGHPQITGYLEYQCQNPESLAWLRFHGFKAMPGLKHTSVWLISDHWQSKQQLSNNQERIQLQKNRGITHFLMNPGSFFN